MLCLSHPKRWPKGKDQHKRARGLPIAVRPKHPPIEAVWAEAVRRERLKGRLAERTSRRKDALSRA